MPHSNAPDRLYASSSERREVGYCAASILGISAASVAMAALAFAASRSRQAAPSCAAAARTGLLSGSCETCS